MISEVSLSSNIIGLTILGLKYKEAATDTSQMDKGSASFEPLSICFPGFIIRGDD